MKFNINIINKISFLYLFISLFIFIIGWFNPLFAIISGISVIIILKNVFKDKFNSENCFYLEKDYIIILLLIIIAWCFLSGIGGYWYQTDTDWHVRNALIHDLIDFNFPVVYENNISLVYYFGFLLVPALFGKLSTFLGCTSSVSFSVAGAISFIWAVCGLCLFTLNLIFITKAEKLKSICALLIFIFFCGMNIFIFNRPHGNTFWMNWAYPYFNFSPIIALQNVFHVVIPIWMILTLFLINKNNINLYGVILLLTLFYCPQVMFGMLIYMIPMFFMQIIKNKKSIISFTKNIFDIKNILSIFVLAPILILFYKSNYIAINDNFIIFPYKKDFMLAFLLNYGFFLLFIFPAFYKKSFYYLTIISILLLPMINFHTSYDFIIKAIIPASFVTIIMIIKFLFEVPEKNLVLNKIYKYLLSISLIIGAVIPVLTLSYCEQKYNEEPLNVVKDNIKTFNNKVEKDKGWSWYYHSDNRNYVSIDYQQYPFWKYIARKTEKNGDKDK